MQLNFSTGNATDPRVILVDGYGVSLSIIRGHLVIKDGVGRYRRERRFSRIDVRSRNGIARLIITAETGFIALDVLNWCESLGIAVAQFQRDGHPVMMSPAYMGDARVRRAQVLCAPGMPLESTGAEIMRELLDAKLSGQLSRLEQWGEERSILEAKRWLSRFREADSTVKMISAEGKLASAYWRPWADRVFVPFKPEDMFRVPSHWNRFSSRAGFTSEANGYKPSNRNATDPVNAMLNYAYAVCFTEAVHSCHAVGLDPAFGFGHGTDKNSQGLALDLVETLRPVADGIVLSMLDHGNGLPFGPDGKPAYLSAESFSELDDGTCRIVPPLTYRIAAEVSIGIVTVATSYAESIVKTITAAANITNQLRTGSAINSGPRFASRDAQTILSPDLTPSDIVPDSLWTVVQPLIPPEPASRTFKPNARSDNRAVLAGILAHELYGSAWDRIPIGLGVDRKTCRRRLSEWQTLGAWDKILSEAAKPGVVRASLPNVPGA
jgi:CRISPR-associated protein Cas1